MNDETTCKQLYGKCLHSCIHYNIHGKLLFMISLFSQERVVGLYHLPHVTLQPLTVVVNRRVLSSSSIFISFLFLSGFLTLTMSNFRQVIS